MSIDGKLYYTLNALADLFNRNTDKDWMIAETLLQAYPVRLQKALIALLATGITSSDGSGALNALAKAKFMGWLTDEAVVWGDD